MKTNAGSNIVIDDIGRVPRYFYAFRNDLCTAKRRGAKEVCIYFAAFFLNMLRVLFKSRDGKKMRIATNVERYDGRRAIRAGDRRNKTVIYSKVDRTKQRSMQ